MSRCFPYPPPGYVSKRANGDSSLIESIKIKRDAEKIKKEKKEQKRRDKEERKKEKKERKRAKEKLREIQNIECTNKRLRDYDGLEKSVVKSLVNSKEVDIHKTNETEFDQLERSSLSEEHGQPVLTESHSYSSDGTQSKTKRHRIDQNLSNGNCTTDGKAVRFRLKHKDHESTDPADDIPSASYRSCSPVTTVFDDMPMKEKPCLAAPVLLADEDIKDALPVSVKKLCLGRAQASNIGTDKLPLCKSSISKAPKKHMSAYDALFSNWVPPLIQFEALSDNHDMEWMFPCKKQARQNQLRLESLNGVSHPLCSSSWPRGHLFPEADLCVLPFTIPL